MRQITRNLQSNNQIDFLSFSTSFNSIYLFEVIKSSWSFTKKSSGQMSVFHWSPSSLVAASVNTDFFPGGKVLGLRKEIQNNQSFPLYSYPKVIYMVYSKQIPVLNIMILINLLISVWKVKKVYKLLVLLVYTIIYFLNFIFEVTFLSILTNHFTK